MASSFQPSTALKTQATPSGYPRTDPPQTKGIPAKNSLLLNVLSSLTTDAL